MDDVEQSRVSQKLVDGCFKEAYFKVNMKSTSREICLQSIKNELP